MSREANESQTAELELIYTALWLTVNYILHANLYDMIKYS